MRGAICLTFVLAAVASAVTAGGCGGSQTRLKVLCATSLMVPFGEMEKAFEALHPDVDVVVEGHGSIQVIRYVTELETEADVVAVADYSLIPMLMYDNPVPATGESYANWYVKFATNRLGLAYTTNSKYADGIDSANWYDILSDTAVKVGLPDPRIDSCGYRALMMCQLAEAYYGDETIFERVIGDFSPPISVSGSQDAYVISVPEVLNPTRLTVRGSSVVLLGLLESGDLDYAFEYESVARQHGLGFVELPPEIALSSESLADQYSHVMVRLDFQRFASVIPEFHGEPIVYALTIPSNAPHPDTAAQFVEFLLSADGRGIMTENHHPPLAVPTTDQLDKLPSDLRLLVQQQ
ncbi:MAG: tungstate ABC transporter substrate-binding protein WtpA [Chloroflexi bacterium]|nr:tungstate ABC transporter substrate-binding protein WtpA [Chloroflexota bacterium]